MTIDSPSNVTHARRPVVFLFATAITLLFGLAHFYSEFAPKSSKKWVYDKSLESMHIAAAGGYPSYAGIMESLNISLSALTTAIGIVNFMALKDAAPTLRKRASLVYCVAFACLGVLYRAHDLLIPGAFLGIAAISYLVDAVMPLRSES